MIADIAYRSRMHSKPPELVALAADVLDRAVDGCNLRSTTLRAELGDRATHVVFLRHFG